MPKPEPDEQRAQGNRAEGQGPGWGEAARLRSGSAQNLKRLSSGTGTQYTDRNMQTGFRLLVVGLLIAIVVSLGSALRHLSRGSSSEEDSRKMARALTIRISLSLALFALLIIAWYMGLIVPHGLQGPGPTR